MLLTPTDPPLPRRTELHDEANSACTLRERLPGYEILGVLGRGGMGVVYKARQVALNRVVALKTIRAGDHAGDADRARFRAAAAAVGRLQHPNIVQIHEVGEHDGVLYFSLEYCGGGDLDARLRGKPLPPRDAATLVETLARAVQYAHDHGVIHRDLKPANVLLAPASGREPDLKISDFGLARRLDEAGGTLSGTVLGTPSYMAPEQALGNVKEVGPAADVYALGAVLYECLTGRPPFTATTPLETLRQVVGDDPLPPRRLQPTVPADLETVCLKCLHKVPSRRYNSAAALADDLRNYLDGRPVAARPAGWPERTVKWARRHPTAAALLAVCTSAVAILTAGAVAFVLRTEADRQTIDRERNEVARQLHLARRHLLTTQLLRVSEVCDTRPDHGLNLLTEAEACPEELRDFAWGWYHFRCRRATFLQRGHSDVLRAVAATADGRVVASGDEGGAIKVWDLARCRKVFSVKKENGEGVHGLAFSPDGALLASAGDDGLVQLWDARTGREVRTLRGHDGPAFAVAFSPDGRLLASGGRDGTVRLWDVAARDDVRVLRDHSGWARSVAFSPDGRLLAVGTGTYRLDKEPPGEVKLWNPATGQAVRTLHGHAGLVSSVAFAPSGKLLASASYDRTVKLWDPVGDVELWTYRDHKAEVNAVTFAADGEHLASAAGDETVRLWKLPVEPFGAHPGHQVQLFQEEFGHNIHGLTFLGGGHALASAGGKEADPGAFEPQRLKLWNTDISQQSAVFADSGDVAAVGFAAGGEQIVSCSSAGVVRRRDAATGTEKARQMIDDRRQWLAAFADGGRVLALVGNSLDWRAEVRVWDVDAGRERNAFDLSETEVICFALSADGTRLATADEGDQVRFWDVATGKKTGDLPGTARCAALALSPDGRTLAVCTWDDEVLDLSDPAATVTLWDLAGLQPIRTLKGAGPVLAFSPDGNTLATGTPGDGTSWGVKLWDVPTGQGRAVLKGHEAFLTSLAFSPDGKSLLSGSRDDTVRLWQALDPDPRQP